ncbi:methylated-DNA--[protein]-cysteine S-methyltransferase [Celeribacter indicus]|uniref:methylated-DNA--[protein]-cysteine S-methyltransferase n=1 Tax=Celeribacter indicus TaxID=1208324 RepID=A0A0B5DZ19_9RHOB|nr:bifunctional helix-turn-helix domain-containing protein/methylated-DNA--[protein]-cysteine S-methyltransferase [Celeribacter indicus]AJE45477.1 ADA regulatory protein [Celeribacter indicus]SDW88048.1 AraC family transcriptional regulator, regulatory protein of adaptative response / methylated-DNA-[protein]-cysteine methyltransferase [Celeribacter indicus]
MSLSARPAEDRYHFHVVRRVIELIDGAREPLPLGTLAAATGLSAPHLQKVFSQWAGVSPKRFQQYLTLGHAKALIDDRRPLAEVADAAGLSGTGRLHDLFLRWEAMTPGDYARRGAGLTIFRGRVDTPFGEAIAMATERGLCALGFTAEMTPDAVIADLSARWPEARQVEAPDRVAPFVEAALAGQTVDLHLMGGPFQIKVWEALLSIPPGEVATYSDIAGAIGTPKAVRAVGTAVGRNPVAWLIPCHRVLRKTGGLGGYHWGLGVKRALLAREGARNLPAAAEQKPATFS